MRGFKQTMSLQGGLQGQFNTEGKAPADFRFEN